MSTLKENARRQERYDTAGNWTSNNPTPLLGEWCYETDTKYLKIGDGSTAWTSLGYTFNATNYSTAWINRSDWTNVHLGTDDTKDTDSNLTHSLSAPLSDLIVKVFISTDGTDANSFEPIMTSRVFDQAVAGAVDIITGLSVFAVDDDNVKVQTGKDGVGYVRDSDGDQVRVDTEDWYYKIKVYKLA